MFIAVDVGNSHLSFSTQRGNGLHQVSVGWSPDSGGFLLPNRSAPVDLSLFLRQSPIKDWLTEADESVAISGDLAAGPIGTPVSWWISSVNPPAAEPLKTVLHQHRSSDGVFNIDQAKIPLDDDLLNRTRTGVDRLLAAWFASRHLSTVPTLGSVAFPGVIVVDAGSAVTVDWVDQAGVFRGGMIYPGLRLAAESLHTGTAALPLITAMTLMTTPPAVGRATLAAMEAGLYWSQWGGLCGAVEALQQFAAARSPKPGGSANETVRPAIVVTGGGIRPFQSLLPPHWNWEPQLMPRAILKFAHWSTQETRGGTH